jgi:two-component system LytT family response regulator
VAIEQHCPDIEIVAICERPEEGLEQIKSLHPDLVFLDIQMPGMSGFDLLQQIQPITFEVIFVTSYDQYAIRAIKFSALDYLLKPVDEDDLIIAVDKAKKRKSEQPVDHQMQSLLHHLRYKSEKIEKVAVPTSDGITFFHTDDIIYCQADGNYTRLHLINNREELVTKILKDFELLLGNSGFCRVHNSFLINLKHIQKYFRGEGGTVILTESHQVDISRRRKEEFLRMLDRI